VKSETGGESGGDKTTQSVLSAGRNIRKFNKGGGKGEGCFPPISGGDPRQMQNDWARSPPAGRERENRFVTKASKLSKKQARAGFKEKRSTVPGASPGRIRSWPGEF